MEATKRLRILQWLIILIFLGITCKLGVLQIAKNDIYRAQAATGAPKETAIKRGDIFFQGRDGLFLAATEAIFYTVAIDSRKILDPQAVYEFLSTEFKLTRAEFATKTNDPTDPFEMIASKISEEQYRSLEARAPAGIVFVPLADRYYPGGTLAAHVLGFLGDSKDGRIGRYGIEQEFETVLAEESGQAPSSLLESFRGGLTFGTGESAVTLTIDPALQTYTEEALDHTLEQWQATRGGAIVMDPRTGKILAMAGRPIFNPNEYQDVKNVGAFINPNIKNLYEMGSVMKPLTMASAFDSGAARPTDTYFDAGFRMIDGYKVENHDKKGRGTIPLQEVLNQSLNTGVIFLVEKMGINTFSSYFKKLNFGERTGIELPDVAGNIKNLNTSRLLEHATASFGQGIAMTPISLARALATIANNGVEPTPYIVAEVRHADGAVDKHTETAGTRVFGEAAANDVNKMLITVVDDALFQGKGKIEGYSVAAKTGTAQIASTSGRGYTNENLHSFFGYAPATNPRFIVLLYMERPIGGGFSSQTLTPPFKEIMSYALQYYQVPPDRQTQ